MESKIIDFQTSKSKIELKKQKIENERLLTKTALTCDYSQYVLMNCMCNLVETSKKIVSDPTLREKHKALLRTRSK